MATSGHHKRMSESQEQASVVQEFRVKYRNHLIFAIPNGTHIKSYAGRTRAKREGLLKGIPDLMIPVAKGGYHGLFVEMKDRGKSWSDVSKNQRERIEQLSAAGYRTVWCIGASAAMKVIDDYMSLPFVDTPNDTEPMICTDLAKRQGFYWHN